jgi:chloramphenicol O-acetyltransferase type A
MREIDSWERREHFRFFSNVACPTYNICFEIDATKARSRARDEGLSFNLTMIHLSVRAADTVENFRYRIRNGNVVLHERLHPVFADMAPGSELFKLVTVDMGEDLADFDSRAAAASRSQAEYFPIDRLAGRDDFIFFSAILWIGFTG